MLGNQRLTAVELAEGDCLHQFIIVRPAVETSVLVVIDRCRWYGNPRRTCLRGPHDPPAIGNPVWAVRASGRPEPDREESSAHRSERSTVGRSRQPKTFDAIDPDPTDAT